MANTSGTGTFGSTIVPPNNYAYATPVFAVDIYPRNGGKYQFTSNSQGTGIVEAHVTKNIRDIDGGKFSITIVPGGPSGIDSSITWTNIIGINSLIIIYASRGGSGRVLMIGVITGIKERQRWTNGSVARAIVLTGLDFTYYFSAFSFYQLTYLGYLQSNFPTGGGGFLLGQFGRMIPGQPQQLASDYLKEVMLGLGNTTSPAVLENTYVLYQNQKFLLQDLFSNWFQYFNESPTLTPYILLAMEVANSDGNWMDKFMSILPWPWYEFFIITATTQDFPSLGIAQGAFTTTLTTFASNDYSNPANVQLTPQQSIGIANPDATPAIIGRINPQPWVLYTTTTTTTGAPPTNVTGTLNRSRWDALTTYSLGSYSFIESDVGYSVGDTANFFIVTTASSNSMAATTGGVDPTQFAVETIGAIISYNSINSFGFLPKAVNTIWWGGQLVKGGGVTPDIQELGQLLMSKLASYYIPSPYMLQGTTTIPMWLDPLPGSKFTYLPFKDNSTSWTFYIEGVTHSFVFGKSSTTTLHIARGLQTTEYQNSDTLLGLLLDNYVRIDGNLVPRPDVGTTGGAYFVLHTNPASSPYASPPNVIGPGTTGATVNVGAPTGTPFGTGSVPSATLQQAFQAAANNCPNLATSLASAGPQYAGIPAWKLLQSLAMSESGTLMKQSAVNGSSYGIMQVNSNSVPPPYTLQQIQTDPYINIQAGGIILCQKLAAAGGNLQNALAFYKGYPGGYNDPIPDIYGNFASTLVDKVLGQLLIL